MISLDERVSRHRTTVVPSAAAATVRPRGRSDRRRGGQVTEIQRARILAAAVETVADRGYARMSVAQVIGRARVSRKTFYDVFADREDCFLAAFDHAICEGRLIAKPRFEREPAWQDGIRCALAALLACMDAQPELATLCVVEAPTAGARVLGRRGEVLAELAAVIDRGRSASHYAREQSMLVAEGMVGAAFTVVHTRLLEGSDQPLSSLVGPLMSMIVLPYLGARAAAQELSRPQRPISPIAVTPRVRTRSDALDGLSMRLTYRTVRVLTFVAEHPGASNREVAEGAGIVDQGQVSKLLHRLAGLGLVENRGPQSGTANVWHLTVRGAQLERASRPLK
jgi:AcrR family transcriptional regulator/DNA-binding MarR family transcriptional regulator